MRLREIRTAVEKSDLARAVALAVEALSEGIENPLLLNLRAYRHEQEGRFGEALTDLERARQIAPDDALINNSLGLCLVRFNRLGEARAAFQEAVRLKPDFTPAYFNLGWVSEDLGLLDEARQAFLRVEQLDTVSADAPARLALLAARMSDSDAARRHAARAFALDPRHPLAHFALAFCEAEDGHLERAEMRLRQTLADGRTNPIQHAMTRGLLGDCLDAGDRLDEAFNAYMECNRELASLYAPQFGSSQKDSMLAHLSQIIDYFTTANADTWNSKNRALPDSETIMGHVFVVGFPCSGKALLEEVLAAHPYVRTTGDTDVLAAAVRQFLGSAEGMDRLSRLDWSDLRVFREMYWRGLREGGLARDDKVLVDRQPDNSERLPLIAKLFPEAKILFTTRDPRDVVFSCFRSRSPMNRVNYELLTLEGAARLYDRLARLIEVIRAKLAPTMLEIPYETLVRDFRNSAVALFRYIGLSPDDVAWDALERARCRAISASCGVQIARGLNLEGIGSWKRYASRMAPALPHLQPWVNQFGAAENG